MYALIDSQLSEAEIQLFRACRLIADLYQNCLEFPAVREDQLL